MYIVKFKHKNSQMYTEYMLLLKKQFLALSNAVHLEGNNVILDAKS